MRKNPRSTFGTNQAIRNSQKKQESSSTLAFCVMQLPLAYPFFGDRSFVEFGQKNIHFGVFFYAFTFGVSIFSWFNFCSNFDNNSSTSACSLMHLPSACRFFADEYPLEFWRKITKNHRFRLAVWCIYLRRVEFLCMNIGWNFDEK